MLYNGFCHPERSASEVEGSQTNQLPEKEKQWNEILRHCVPLNDKQKL